MNSLIILLPAIICITLAVITREIILSISVGIMVGAIIYTNSIVQGFLYGANTIVESLTAAWFIKNIIFLLLIGAIINVMEESGGVEGFIHYVTKKNNYIDNGKKALFLSYLVGLGMFLDGIGSMMTAGMVGRPLIKQHNEPKEKLAFVCNSTGAPVAFLFPFGGAGAFIMGIIGGQIELGVISGNPFVYLIQSIGFQFYTVLMIIVVPLFIFSIKDYGPMATVKVKKGVIENIETEATEKSSRRIDLMILPVSFLIISIVTIILVTGGGSLMKGDATAGIYYGSLLTVIFTGVYMVLTNGCNIDEYIKWGQQGMKKMFPAIIILVLASAFGSVMNELGIANYLSKVILDRIDVMWIPMGIFITCFIISFTTGSSGATVMIMLPIIIPIAVQSGILLPLTIGATISGAVFGDQSSPVSDSVIVASMASGCNVMDHFKTQFPYTVTIGGVSAVLFIIAGAVFI